VFGGGVAACGAAGGGWTAGTSGATVSAATRRMRGVRAGL